MNTEWIIDINDIEIGKKIGKGEFGIIYKGKWRGVDVAIKEFIHLNEHRRKIMINEFNVMIKLHHPHIVQIYGYIDEPFMIVMEYFKNGSLEQYLKKKRFISFGKKIQFMKDITKALCYLHKRFPDYIIHRDIKTSNFLLTDDLKLKISDFGTSKTFKLNKMSSLENLVNFESNIENVGTIRYMAPELFETNKQNIKYNSRIDIYSFGVCMYEIFENRKIYDYCSSIDEFKKLVKNNKTNLYFHKSPSFLSKLIKKCLSINPNDRPNSVEILYHLNVFSKKCWLNFYF
jgi:serine/threonine protein kinase